MGQGSGGDASLALAQQQQVNLDAALKQINSAFTGFTPDFYSNVQKDYEQYAMPQLTGQYIQNKQQLEGNLSGQGLTRSSAAQQLGGLLQQNLAQGQRGVADQGLQQSQQFQQQVQQQQNQLVQQAEASSDPLAIAQGALNTAAGISAPSTFAPIGNLFGNWANFYTANQQNNAVNQQNQLLNQALSSGLAGSGSGTFAPNLNSGVVRGY